CSTPPAPFWRRCRHRPTPSRPCSAPGWTCTDRLDAQTHRRTDAQTQQTRGRNRRTWAGSDQGSGVSPGPCSLFTPVRLCVCASVCLAVCASSVAVASIFGLMPAPGGERAMLSRDLADFLIELSIAVHKHAMYPEGHPSLAPP